LAESSLSFFMFSNSLLTNCAALRSESIVAAPASRGLGGLRAITWQTETPAGYPFATLLSASPFADGRHRFNAGAHKFLREAGS
jgi:hypothetical protein